MIFLKKDDKYKKKKFQIYKESYKKSLRIIKKEPFQSGQCVSKSNNNEEIRQRHVIRCTRNETDSQEKRQAAFFHEK